MTSPSFKHLLEFIDTMNILKHAARQGWVERDITGPETISGHMYSMAMMTFFLAEDKDSNLDRNKCMQMALVHDLAECIVGDITPRDNIPEDVKHRMEDEAMKKLTNLLGTRVGDEIYTLYKEYEARVTPEAKFVKDLDMFDMICTARCYEKRQEGNGQLQEFFYSTRGKFGHPLVKGLVEELEKQRSEDLQKESL